MRHSTGGSPYAIGEVTNGGWFRVRCILFGKLAASYEMRSGEEIRAVKITGSFTVADKVSKPERVL